MLKDAEYFGLQCMVMSVSWRGAWVLLQVFVPEDKLTDALPCLEDLPAIRAINSFGVATHKVGFFSLS